jgi:2-polyprenyl-3-methyl-5-hydroxy-6-metoxy-1,4-benzoquinol methylase
LEIGGGVSGLQFVLSRIGCSVVNVDPGQEEMRSAWSYDKKDFAELNQRFGTNVEMCPTTIDNAGLEDKTFDCAYSISVLEHLSSSAISTIMTHVWRCLKPGSRFVLTIDLFLNLEPFTRRSQHEYGTNINIKWLLDQASFYLEKGNTRELFGFDEFNAESIQSNLAEYLIAVDYPALAQCFVLRKPF